MKFSKLFLFASIAGFLSTQQIMQAGWLDVTAKLQAQATQAAQNARWKATGSADLPVTDANLLSVPKPGTPYYNDDPAFGRVKTLKITFSTNGYTRSYTQNSSSVPANDLNFIGKAMYGADDTNDPTYQWSLSVGNPGSINRDILTALSRGLNGACGLLGDTKSCNSPNQCRGSCISNNASDSNRVGGSD